VTGFWIFLGLIFVGLMIDKGLVAIANMILLCWKDKSP
jgi:hypothetical protein